MTLWMDEPIHQLMVNIPLYNLIIYSSSSESQ